MSEPVFSWEDSLGLEDALAEDEKMVRDKARGYAQDVLMPRVLAAYRDESANPEMIREMGNLGLLGPTTPEPYRGAGLGNVTMYPILAYGTEKQRRKHLP